MTKDEALTLALEALEYASTGNRRPEIIGPAITAIKEALAQPEQDDRRLQIAMRQWEDWKAYALELQKKLVKYEGGSPMILNTQPERPWVGLAEHERVAIAEACGAMSADWLVFVEAVEKALKEKNT